MTVQTRINIKPHIILSVLLFAFCLSLCFGIMKMTAYADNGGFSIDAQLLSSNDETFDISVTVENTGDDWEGVARVKVEDLRSFIRSVYTGTYIDCAYDVAISLPQGSIKQFVVKVPKQSYNSEIIGGNIAIFLIDKNSESVFSKKFDKLLLEEKDALKMGILSDDYSSLTFMDMGGEKLDYNGSPHPVKLVELNQDNLSGSLESLDFLVIDNYNTGILTAYETAAIEKWNRNGGVLIVGTGKYAENTLAGLDYLDVEYGKIYDAEDDDSQWGGSWIDMTGLEAAELVYPGYLYHENSFILAIMKDKGDGAIGVLPYSLTEFAGRHGDAYEEFAKQHSDALAYSVTNNLVYDTLDITSRYAHRRYDSITVTRSYDVNYINGRFLSAFGNGNDSLSFVLLKIIIIIYVILVSPMLYVVLRSLKKKDLYWLAVPALSFMGVIIVMFAGKGLEVAHTRVYSVTVSDVLGQEDCMTYMHCYNAGHNEWKLCLAQDYEYAAPTVTATFLVDAGYRHRVLKEGERLFLGAAPTSSFEDVYFYAGKKADMEGVGSIDCNESLYADNVRRINKVTNNTGYDFEYLAVLEKGKLRVYEGLSSGETCNPVRMQEIFMVSTDSYYYSDYISRAYATLENDNLDSIMALGIGISSAFYRLETDEMAVIGVTSDYIKAVDDGCSEEAYGCFYIIQ